MPNKLLGFVIVFSVIISSAIFAQNFNRNYECDIKASCFNDTSGTSEPGCYPFWYENGDGSANGFANYVAVLNYVSPVISIGSIKLSHYLINICNQQIDASVTEKLKDISGAEEKIRKLLAEIIEAFDNGINDHRDYLAATGIIEELNRQKCLHCINTFVEIVSKHFSNKNVDRDNEDGMPLVEELSSGRKENNKRFYQFGVALHKGNSCREHCYQEIASPDPTQKNVKDRCASACLDNWTHAFHWSSIVCTGVGLVVPPCMALLVDIKNRAGSYIGDMANISNAIFIPAAYFVSAAQNWLNRNRKEQAQLLEEIERRLANNDGIVEIAARVIGKMDNNITVKQARGYLKGLVLLGWPENFVAQFFKLASGQDNDFATFNNNLDTAIKQKKLPYGDDEIVAALNSDTTIEMNQL